MSAKREITAQDLQWLIAALNEQRNKYTEAEKIMEAILDDTILDYEREAGFIIKNLKGLYEMYILDFYMPAYSRGIEINGGYHFTITGKESHKTAKKKRQFEICDVPIMSFTNKELIEYPETIRTDVLKACWGTFYEKVTFPDRKQGIYFLDQND